MDEKLTEFVGEFLEEFTANMSSTQASKLHNDLLKLLQIARLHGEIEATQNAIYVRQEHDMISRLDVTLYHN